MSTTSLAELTKSDVMGDDRRVGATNETVSTHLNLDPTDGTKTRAVIAPELETLRRPLSSFTMTDIVAGADQPPNRARELRVSQAGFTEEVRWITASPVYDSDMTSDATCYQRRPLYFEDKSLERCWYQDGWFRGGIWTNPRSAIKFTADTVLWPYRMIRQHPGQLTSHSAK